MNRREAMIYRARYRVAEAVFSLASAIKPTYYEFDAVRAAGMEIVCSIGERIEACGSASLDDLVEFYKTHKGKTKE